MTDNQLAQLTFKRLVKGQLEKIKRHRNWKSNIALAVNYMYQTINQKVNKIDVIMCDILTNCKTLSNKHDKQMNDSRYANQRTIVVFEDGKKAHMLIIDQKKRHLHVTISTDYIITDKHVTIVDTYKPFKAYQIDEKCLNIDPRHWVGIPCAKRGMCIEFDNKEKLYN